MSTGLEWISEALEVPNKGAVLLMLRFKFNSSSNPTVFTGAEHLINGVTRDAAGIWTITLKEKFRNWQGVLNAQATAEIDADGTSYFLTLGPMNETNGTIEVRAHDAGESGINTASKTLAYTQLTDADGSQDFNFASALPTGAIVLGGSINVTTAFTDGAAGVFTADLGHSGDVDSILDGAALGSIAHVSTPQGVKESGYYGAITPRLTALATVNLNTATAGACTAYVYYLDPASDAALQPVDVPAGSNDGNWCNVALLLKYSKAIDGSGIPA